MKQTLCLQLTRAVGLSLLLIACIWPSSPALARDTDIYSVNAKQNAYVLMDSSDSMNFGVYEHTIDYGAMFDYLFTLKDSTTVKDYIYDTVNNSSYFYKNHQPAQKIYLWKGRIGVTIANIDGKNIAFSGDAADPDYLWFMNNLVDTHTLIDVDGNLSDDGTGGRRITVDANGYILLDGQRLPLGLDIKEHDFATFYNGSVVDNGFNGLLNAPGYYFSGYEGVALNNLDVVENSDQDVFFFVTGNWVNMQSMYNLHYTTNNPTPQGASLGDMAWPFEIFPVDQANWQQIAHNLDYPSGTGDYSNNLTENSTAQNIVSAGAKKIQIHFSFFDVEKDNDSSTFTKDYVALYDQAGTLIGKYDNGNPPTAIDGGWSPVMTGDTATLKLFSNNSTTRKGYTIDKIRFTYIEDSGGSYLMQSRMDVAKDAMIYVVDEFRGKMNWGFGSFGNNSTGASLGPYLNPTDNDDTQRAAIVQQIDNVTASGGTPLMEALQDVWQDGYWGRRNVLDSLLCRKNYVISMTDGFPSEDDDNARITGVTFDDWDNDDWTQDPYQGLGNKPDYYDDVAHWMYTHSWLDGSLVADPANSYVNVITHHIAFGAKHPLLEDAAGESGGEYIVAYNKEQLIAAFYSLALMMSEAVSFTAPVVSVDAVNKIQSGEDIYMGLFLPQESNYWVGNVKKFKIGDGSSADRPTRFMIYDAKNNEAVDNDGKFVDNTAAFWGNDLDANDTDNYGAADIKEDGAGEVLLEDVQGFFTAKTYWNRPIYTWKNGGMVKLDRTQITAADLAVADDATRDKLINFIHGYTYDADVATGAPKGVRDWILGSIIHSQPVVVDYYDTADPDLPLVKRLIAVGSNDGMLHIFDDTTGREVLAFIPQDILPSLKAVQANDLYDSVDGLVTLHRRNNNPKYLIFGERRGGSHFWNLDISDSNPLNWTVKWDYTNAEITQSWSEVRVASIPVGITSDGEKLFKEVAIFTGGYDPEEDYYPEPFTDQDSNGTPFTVAGNIDNAEWSKNTAAQDVYDDDVYNTFNPGMNEYGRGIFVVDIDNPATVTNVTLDDGTTKQLLPFSVTYGAAAVTSGSSQTLPQMKFSFPASPTVVVDTDKYVYKTATGLKSGLQTNVLLSAYAVDIYANLFKTNLEFAVKNLNPTLTAPDWKVTAADWKVGTVFSGNPGSTSTRAGMAGFTDSSDQGRKAFYSPTVSWGGSTGYFEAGNYFFENVEFTTKNKMASLFFGTGDRENPKYSMIRNRFYAIYDDLSIEATLDPQGTPTAVPISSAPYSEVNLINLTCDELGPGSVINSCYLGGLNGACDTTDGSSADVDMKQYLSTLLTDDAVYNTPSALEYGAAHENDAKGWYIVLADQGKAGTCGHMSYSSLLSNTTSSDRDNHDGEKILSFPLLYYGILYFTSYQPSTSDPCNPQGNGYSYAINYLTGGASYNLNAAAGGSEDLTDRYTKYTDVPGIPSSYTFIISEGEAAAMASMGSAIVGPGPGATLPARSRIRGPNLGLQLYYWRDSRSQ